jgi:integrase
MSRLRKVRNSSYWYVDGLDWAGKRYLRSTKQTNKAAAGRVAAHIELEKSIPGIQPLSLSSALDSLYSWKQLNQVSEASLEQLSCKGARLMEHFGPDRDLNDPPLSIEETEGYVAARRTHVLCFGVRRTPKPGRVVKDSTIAMELKFLFEALRLAKRNKKFAGDVDELRPKVLRPSAAITRVLTPTQFLAVWRKLPLARREDDRTLIRDYVLIFCHLGVRLSELPRIEAHHVDSKNSQVWVVGKKGHVDYRERHVPCSPEALAVLQRRARLRPSGALFPAIPSCNIRDILARACERAGVAVRPSANDFRRSFVTWQGMFGTPDSETGKFVGHSPNSRMVKQVYRQLHAESGRAAVAQFPQVGLDDEGAPLADVIPISRGA